MTHLSNSTPTAATPRLSTSPASWGDRLDQQRRIPAWALSLLLHLATLGLLSFIITQVPSGAGLAETRRGGIVLINETSESTEYLSEGAVAQNSHPEVSSASAPPLAAEHELAPNLPGVESAVNDIRESSDRLAQSLPGVETMMLGPKISGEIGGQVTTDVFGIKGTGSRFVYVIDRSESMAGYEFRPLLAARQELWKSLHSLKENNQFQIVFYNDRVKILNQQQRLFFANQQRLEQAESFIIRNRPNGGTDHLKALQQAFKFAPDVIFFLTDAEGGFSQSDLREISRRNRSAAIIHAIEFGERPTGDDSLQSVARRSGGQYIFKNINTLQLKGFGN